MEFTVVCPCGNSFSTARVPAKCPGCGFVVGNSPGEPPFAVALPAAGFGPVASVARDSTADIPTVPGFHPAGLVAFGIVVLTAAGGFTSGLKFVSWFGGGAVGAVLAMGAMRRLPGPGGALSGRGWARVALVLALIELAVPFAGGIFAIRWLSAEVRELSRGLRK